MARVRFTKRPSKAQVLAINEFLGAKTRILAWGDGEKTAAFATQQGLIVDDRQLFLLPWERILRGGWRPEEQELWWELVDGTKGQVVLDEPETLLGVFRECVQASILVELRMTAPGGQEVVISARRSLAGADIYWHVWPIGNTDLNSPEVKEFVIAKTNQLRMEYEENQ